MFLQAELNRAYEALKASEELSDFSIIKAYPYVKKPTILQSTVITICPAASNLKSVSLGSEELFGTYGIYVDVFIPQQEGSPCDNTAVEGITEALLPLGAVKVSISDVEREDVLNAFCVRCLFEFSAGVEAETEEENG